MARSRKTTPKEEVPGKPDEEVADDALAATQEPEVSEAGAAEDVIAAEPESAAAEKMSAPEEPAAREETREEAEDAPAEPDPADGTDLAADDAESDTRAPVEAAEELHAATAPPPPPPAPARSGMGGIALLLIGGAAAALIGFLAARYLDDLASRQAEGPTPAENAAALADQAVRLDAMQATLDGLSSRDIGAEIAAVVEPVRTELDGALGDTSARLDALSGDLAALAEQVETIAMRPVATGIDADAFDDALAEFRSDLDAAIAEANKAVADAQAEITEARETAQEISDEAFRAEQASIARAAWSQVAAAIDSGTPYAEALAEATAALAVPVPDVVAANAEKGVPSLAALQESFPDAARRALDASIRASAGDGALDKLTAFIRVQSGARSLAPRDGDDPDAVLSRAEAAVQKGDLDTAISELAALPEPGQAAMAGWREAAATRIAARSATADIAQKIEQD